MANLRLSLWSNYNEVRVSYEYFDYQMYDDNKTKLCVFP